MYRDMLRDHPRPHQGHGREEDDARAGEGRAADARLRRPLRIRHRPVDDGDVHRGHLPRDERVDRHRRRRGARDEHAYSLRLAWLRCASRLLLPACDAAGQGRGRGQAGPPQTAATGGTDRSHRHLGVGRHRGLALAHGDAAEGRCRERAGERRRTQGRAGWDLAADNAGGNQCKAFGVGGIMRQPGRLRISWQDDETLKLEFDAGTQTRLLNFDRAKQAPAEKTLAGLLARAVGRSGRRPRRSAATDVRVTGGGSCRAAFPAAVARGFAAVRRHASRRRSTAAATSRS